MDKISPRLIDRIGSFSDPIDLHRFNCSSYRNHWIVEARMKMHLYLTYPKIREMEIGDSDGMAIVYGKDDGKPILIKIIDEVFLYFVARLPIDSSALGAIQLIQPDRRRDPLKVGALTGSKTFSGVGTALMQAGALEWSCHNGNNLQFSLLAIRDSYAFYWNFGMHTNDNYINEFFAKKIAELRKKGLKRLELDVGMHNMQLTGAAAATWLSRIRQDPILYETRDEVARLKFVRNRFSAAFSLLIQQYINPSLAYD